jgi:hypothetical protein
MNNPLIKTAEKKKCFLWFHDWSKWEKTKEEVLEKKSFYYGQFINKGITGSCFYQQRRCERCGKYQLDY